MYDFLRKSLTFEYLYSNIYITDRPTINNIFVFMYSIYLSLGELKLEHDGLTF